MNLRARRVQPPDVNLTPLIDVVFLLLIFFMVSTTFDREAQLAIELPSASGEVAEREPKTIEVAIDAQGRFFVGGKLLVNTQLVTLKRAIEESMDGAAGAPMVINADANARHQAVVLVMDAARQLRHLAPAVHDF